MNAKSTFQGWFPGHGRLDTKQANGHRVFTGEINLPGHGACFLDGIAPLDAEHVDLIAKRRDTRATVAKVRVLSGSGDEVREGRVVYLDSKRKWKLEGKLRESTDSDGTRRKFLKLRMPEVKATSSYDF